MAKRVKMGRVVTVENKDRRFGSALHYQAVKLEMESGRELYALFTHKELVRAIKRAAQNPEDVIKTSWLRDLVD